MFKIILFPRKLFLSRKNIHIFVINMAKSGERVSKEKIERKPGFLYYLGSDGYVWQNPMKSNKTGKKAKVGTEKIEREAGYIYFVDSEGYVARTKMARRTKAKK